MFAAMGRRKEEDPAVVAARLLGAPERALVAELLDAIRRVNPTGLELSEAAERRRYRLKSQLQSLLVRRFPDEVDMIRAPDSDGAVLLRHRYAERGGAAHALVAELDEDARSIVQRRLDEEAGEVSPGSANEKRRRPVAGSAVPAAATSESDGEPAGQLRLGRAALASYDFDAARSHLELAFARSGGALDAALSLVELLVEHLAQDEDALAVASRLSPAAADHPALRALLALAAGRCGDRPAVERWLRGVNDEGAVPAWLALTDRALGNGRDDEAAACFDCAREAGAATADLVGREAEMTRLRSKRWRDVDADLDRALAAGDLEDTEARAREILSHWPEAPVARRLVAVAKERRRAEQCASVLAEASHALARGETDLAATRSAAARALGADTVALDEAIAAEAAAARRHRERTEIDRMVARLTDCRSRAALLAYLELPPHLRDQVRITSGRDALGWLDELGNLSDSRAAAAVDGIMALEQLRTDDPDAVIATLEPHEAALHRVKTAGAMLARARAAIAVKRRRVIEEQLVAASKALEENDLDRAADLLSRIPERALDGGGRDRRQALASALEHAGILRGQVKVIDDRILAGDFLGAKTAIELLLESANPEERDRWSARYTDIAEQARQQWPVYELSMAGAPIGELPHLGAELGAEYQSLPVWYSLDGDALFLACSHSRWIFVYVIDLATQRLRRAVVVPLPSLLGRRDVTVWRNVVWVVGDERLFAVDLNGLAVHAWRDLHGLSFPVRGIRAAHVLPDAGYLWVHADEGRAVVIDLRRWTQRDAKVGYTIARLLGSGAPLIASFSPFGTIGLREADGRARDTYEVPGHQVHALAPHPQGGDRRLALLSRMTPDRSEPLRLALADTERRDRQPLSDVDGERPHALVAPSAHKVAVVASAHGVGATRVHGFRADGDLAPLYQFDVPYRLVLAEDTAARRAVALFPTSSGLGMRELTDQMPVVEGGVSISSYLSAFRVPFDCAKALPPPPGWRRGLLDRLVTLDGADFRAELDRIRREYERDVGVLLAITGYLPVGDHPEHLEFIERHHRGNTLADLQRADLDACSGAWESVAKRLEAIGVVTLPAPSRPHYFHILGIAILRTGHHDEARRAFESARELGGKECQIEECLDWLNAIVDEQGRDATSLTEPERLARALRLAGGCLEGGDADGARRALERSEILAVDEGQSLARLAAAWLALPSVDDLARVQKAQALARFCAWCEAESRCEAVPLSGPWDAERLGALRLQATSWLDGNVPSGHRAMQT